MVVAAVASHVTAVQALKLPSDLTTYHNALSFSTGCCLIGMIARLVSLIPCLSWHVRLATPEVASGWKSALLIVQKGMVEQSEIPWR